MEAPEEDPPTEGTRSEHLSGYGLFDYKSLFLFEENKADEENDEPGTSRTESEAGKEGPLKGQRKARVRSSLVLARTKFDSI